MPTKKRAVVIHDGPLKFMAERKRFELLVPLRVHMISNHAPSASSDTSPQETCSSIKCVMGWQAKCWPPSAEVVLGAGATVHLKLIMGWGQNRSPNFLCRERGL